MRQQFNLGLSLALLASAASAQAEYQARAVIKSLDRAVLSGELAARVAQFSPQCVDFFVGNHSAQWPHRHGSTGYQQHRH